MAELPPAANQYPKLIIQRRLTEGRALSMQNKFTDAKSHLESAQGLARLHAPELLGDVALARANLLHRQDFDKKAEHELQRAEELAREYQNKLLEAKVLGTFGQIYTAEGYYDKALDSSEQALRLSQLLQAHHIEAGVRLNMGWSYYELGDFDQAIPLFTKSERLAAEAGMKLIQESSLNNLGRISRMRGDFAAAKDYFWRALQIAKTLQQDSTIVFYLDNLALVSLDMGNLDDAERYNHESLTLQDKYRDPEERSRLQLTAASIANARKHFAAATEQLSKIIHDKGAPKSVRWAAAGDLAEVYVATRKTALAQIEFKEALAILDHAWESIKQDENKFAFSTWTADFYTDYIRFLVNQGEQEKALQVAESMRARTLEDALGTRKTLNPGLISLPFVHSYLRQQQQVVLAYWLAPERSFLWVITPSRVELLLLPSKQEIKAKVEQYQKNITSLGDPLKGDQVGQELYRILVEPAQKFIPVGARVVIIPDGNLGKLNFETLIVPGNPPHYWVEDVELKASSSVSLVVHARPDQRSNHKLLIIGDPEEVTTDYRKLIHAKEEIAAATNHFAEGAKKVVSGPAATPSSYAANKPEEFDLIHFATHGFASDTKPLDSAIILSADSDKNFKLYARDIIKIPIKAEVVTISACYGAGERTYSGEGLVGLAWAFLRAGAHRVIAGLWKVDDESTPQLMDNFYAEMQSGTQPAKALRDAKLKMLGSKGRFRLPYYWASLQLYTGS